MAPLCVIQVNEVTRARVRAVPASCSPASPVWFDTPSREDPFKGYLFCDAGGDASRACAAALRINGRLLGAGDSPSWVDDSELRACVDRMTQTRVETQARLLGSPAMILGGAFVNLVGEITGFVSDLVLLRLQFMGRQVEVRVPMERLEVLPT